jgi:hypothetical protein
MRPPLQDGEALGEKPWPSGVPTLDGLTLLEVVERYAQRRHGDQHAATWAFAWLASTLTEYPVVARRLIASIADLDAELAWRDCRRCGRVHSLTDPCHPATAATGRRPMTEPTCNISRGELLLGPARLAAQLRDALDHLAQADLPTGPPRDRTASEITAYGLGWLTSGIVLNHPEAARALIAQAHEQTADLLAQADELEATP